MSKPADFNTPKFPTWCPGCVLPDTLIQTNPSTRPITAVHVGDLVMGSDGDYHRVTKTYAHRHQGDLYRVKVKCFGTTVLTPEHPVLTVKRENRHWHNRSFPILWEEAANLKKGDYVLYPIPSRKEDIAEVELPAQRKLMDRKSKPLPKKIPVTSALLRIVGFYISEGWTHHREIGFALHAKERPYAQQIMRDMKKVFGLHGTIKQIPKKTLLEIYFNSSVLARAFNEWFGKGAPNKKIPRWLMMLPPREQKVLLCALWQGDGYVQWHKNRASFKTSSLQLAEQVKLILLRQRIIPTISDYRAYGIHKQSYAIQVVNDRDFAKLAAILNPSQRIQNSSRNGKTPSSLLKGDYALLPIRNVEKFRYDGPVHNLEVEGVNSYLTRSATLHNCGDFGIWGSLKQAYSELGLEPHQFAVVYGIGCSGNMCSFVNCYGFEGLHGRGIPVAAGIKMANPDLPVVMVGGDGDILGEGMGHFIHACRANHNLNIVIHNNQVYGLTTGQTSPTSEKGMKTKSTPHGVIEEQTNPIALALTAGATFVARGFAGDIPTLTKLIKAAITHPGFAVLDVLQPCVTFNKINTYAWFRERVYKLEDKGYTQTTKAAALAKALEPWHEQIPLGIFWQEKKPSYEDMLPQLKEKGPLRTRDLSHIDITPLYREFQ